MKIRISPEEGGCEQEYTLSLSQDQLINQLLNDSNRVDVVCLKGRSSARTVVTDRRGISLIGHSFILDDGSMFDSTLECFLDDGDSIKEFIERSENIPFEI